MKKVLSLVLVLTMVLGSFSMAFAAAPNDVVGTEYEDAVERLIQLGVLTGYTDGTFKPENTITRSEFAAAVVRAKGLKAAAEAAQGATAFADVPANNWASGYVNVASKMGFVKGYPNGNFGLNDPITYEQAVTLVVRALGYEPAAMSKGGYPYGYLIVANEIELLDSVKGTQGLPAPRGLVAQLIDNALETPLMVQVSYGDRVEHIVSGSRDGVEEKTLLSELNFTKVTGRVTEINEDKSLIRIGDKSLKVAEGFDFQEALGLKLRAWYNDSDKIILYTKLDTPMFDAVEHDDGGLYLYGEDKTYDLATDKDDKVIATLILDGKTVKTSNVEDFDADYAKVVLDSYGDIIWVEGFTFDGNIAVEKLDGNVVESYGYEELSLKNYTIVKEGKTISVDDLEENDIVFYNKDNKFAVVANITAEGTIEKVYTDRFVVAGETYDIDGRYLDADEMDDLSSAALDSMRKEEKEATVFFDFKGNVVLVVGTRAASTTASNYFLLAEVSNEWTDDRNDVEYYSLDVLNAEGKIVKYDVKQSEVNDDDDTVEFITPSDMSKDWMTVLGDEDNAEKLILKLTLNTKDKVTAVEVLENHEISDDLKVTAGYVGGFKLQDSTVIFRADGEAVEDYAVTTWAKAEEEFSKIELGKYYVGANGRVVAIFAEETDAPDADLEYYGRIKDVRELRNGLKEVVILSEGEEHTFVTESKTIDGFAELKDYAMVKITVVNKTEEIRKVEKLVPVNAKIEDLKPGSKIIETDKGEFELTEKAVIYKAPRVSTLRFADLEIGDYLDIYTRTGSSRFAIYAVKVDGPETGSNTGMTLTTAADKASVTVTKAVYKTDYVLKVTDIDTKDVVYSTGTANVNGDVVFEFSPAIPGNAVYKFELFKDSPVAANLVNTWEDQFIK